MKRAMAHRRHFATPDPLETRRWERGRDLAAKRAASKPDPLAWVQIPARLAPATDEAWKDLNGNTWTLTVEPETDDCRMGDLEPYWESNRGGHDIPPHRKADEVFRFDRRDQFGTGGERHSYPWVSIKSDYSYDPRPESLRDAARDLNYLRIKPRYGGSVATPEEIAEAKERLRAEAEAWRVQRSQEPYRAPSGKSRHKRWESTKACALKACEAFERQNEDEAPWGYWARVTVTSPDGDEIANKSLGGLCGYDDDPAGWREILRDSIIADAAHAVREYVPTASVNFTANDLDALRKALDAGASEIAADRFLTLDRKLAEARQRLPEGKP